MDIASVGLQGLADADTRFTRAAARITNGGAGGPVDSVDLSTEAVDLLTSKEQYLASLQVVETGQDMAKQTIDLLA